MSKNNEMKIATYLFIILLLVFQEADGRQLPGDSAEVSSEKPEYLLLDKSLQFRITEAINSMYDFDFETAERGFAVMRYSYPEHPLPYFLMGLAQWWKIVPDMENKKNDKIFLRFMEETIAKAEVMLEEDPENKEAAFFLAAAYGFKGRLLSERDS